MRLIEQLRRWDSNGVVPLPIRPEDIASSIEAVPAPSLLETQAGQVSRRLEALRMEQAAVRAHITERTERDRQLTVLIEAFTSAERTIEAGKMPMAAE